MSYNETEGVLDHPMVQLEGVIEMTPVAPADVETIPIGLVAPPAAVMLQFQAAETVPIGSEWDSRPKPVSMVDEKIDQPGSYWDREQVVFPEWENLQLRSANVLSAATCLSRCPKCLPGCTQDPLYCGRRDPTLFILSVVIVILLVAAGVDALLIL